MLVWNIHTIVEHRITRGKGQIQNGILTVHHKKFLTVYRKLYKYISKLQCYNYHDGIATLWEPLLFSKPTSWLMVETIICSSHNLNIKYNFLPVSIALNPQKLSICTECKILWTCAVSKIIFGKQQIRDINIPRSDNLFIYKIKYCHDCGRWNHFRRTI